MIELTTTERARAALWMLQTAAATERLLGQMANVNAGPHLQRELDRAGLAMRSLRTAAAAVLNDGGAPDPDVQAAVVWQVGAADVHASVAEAALHAARTESWLSLTEWKGALK